MARAFLLIADIGGYTRFMKVHRINLSHAQYVVAQLLEAVIDAASPTLKLSKLEGDAAFFWGKLDRDEDIAKYARQVADIRRAFLERRQQLAIERVCTCDGCVQAGDLKLKFVAHEGEIAFQKVKRLTELAGVDVILVHRLLKNSVPVPEYVLMSEAVHQRIDDALRPHVRASQEDLEGFGTMPTFYIDLVEIAEDLPATLEASFFRRVLGWLKMTWRSLPYFLGVRTPCEGFANLGEIGPLPPALAASTAQGSRASAGTQTIQSSEITR